MNLNINNCFDNLNDDILLMCKDTPVYNISQNIVINANLLPGSMYTESMTFDEWIKTRYSADSNITARRLMMRAFSTDNHGFTIKTTRALSLSDCYWLKSDKENILFSDVSPYFNQEWDGSGRFSGGSISTLFVNGAANKQWINSEYLVKFSSVKEMSVYSLCYKAGIDNISKAKLINNDLYVTNFTNHNVFLESLAQSGFVSETENHTAKCIDLFGKPAAMLFAIDYITEHDDRHSGNIGFLRDSNTGRYLSLAPYYDFDWAFSGNTYSLPENAFANYSEDIFDFCNTILSIRENLQYKETITNRCNELINIIHEKKYMNKKGIDRPSTCHSPLSSDILTRNKNIGAVIPQLNHIDSN